MVLLVNQHIVPVFSDIVNAFAERGRGPILFAGHIEKGGKPLSARIEIRRSTRYNRASSFSRFVTWLLFTIHYSFYLAFCRKPEFVLVTTNPPLAPIVTAWISKLRNIPFYILLYDLYPEAMLQADVVKEGNLIFHIWMKLNRSMFKNARHIFTLSESMKRAAGKYLTSDEKIRVISNWADTSFIHPVPKASNPFVKAHGLMGKFVVLYSGNMGLTHDLESLVEAAGKVRDLQQVVFVLIGDGGKRRILEQLARSNKMDNVLFLPHQDENNFPLAMASADVGVVTLGNGAEGISVPSKTYVNLAAGLCLLGIAPGASELNRIIREHKVGFVCEPGRADEIERTIRLLFNDRELLQYHKDNALKASRFFTSEKAYEYVNQTGSSLRVTL